MKTANFSMAARILLVITAVFLPLSQSVAAQKARGVVITTVKAGENPCSVIENFLEKPAECTAETVSNDVSMVLVEPERKVRLKEGQSVLLKAGKELKTTGKVLKVLDMPVQMEELTGLFKDNKMLIFWKDLDGKTLNIIRPDRDFMPEKDQQVKLKVKKEVAKVEGC